MERGIFTSIAVALVGAYLIYTLYKYISTNPEALSRESLSKSFGTMGLLGIALIIFVAVVVMLLRRT